MNQVAILFTLSSNILSSTKSAIIAILIFRILSYLIVFYPNNKSGNYNFSGILPSASRPLQLTGTWVKNTITFHMMEV